jgi:hypothetical protein
MKKLINGARKGLMESLLTKPLTSALLWVKKSFSTRTRKGGNPVNVVTSPRP